MSLIRRLGTACSRVNVNVSGIGGNPVEQARKKTKIYLHLPDSNTPLLLEVYCLERLGLSTPAAPLEKDVKKLWEGLTLADPEFNIPKNIDLLIGADVYGQLQRSGLLKWEGFTAQLTAMGWTITGSRYSQMKSLTVTTYATLCDMQEPPWHEKLMSLIQRFWELEEVPRISRPNPDNEECERIFSEHHRDRDGRYVVRLPIRPGGLDLIGESYFSARATLRSTQNRMLRDPELAKEYRKFMEEYVRSGHMRPLTAEEVARTDRKIHYIPHHGIWQKGDQGRKLRVVFNASRPTSSGHSLNDAMFSGPKLLNNLSSVLTRWRQHRIAFCTDIKMMFRQIRVDERDVDLQRILWCSDDKGPVTHYQLLTVTYGETCSPYLSLRALEQLCRDEGSLFPKAVNVIRKDKYADDFLSGAHDIESAKELRDQLILLMKAGGFPLRKWIANTPELLDDLSTEERLRPTWLKLNNDGPVSELGVIWDPGKDVFRFVPPSMDTRPKTKRLVLAQIAKIFDPCGWLAPITLIAKQIMQDLWRAKLTWDELLPPSMASRWSDFESSLKEIPKISIPRWIHQLPENDVELHVFADASRRAMAAVVYVKVTGSERTSHISLLASKTKLTSVKSLKSPNSTEPRMTIPRLELRAAVMASEMLCKAASDLSVPFSRCYAWSDAAIVLRWIKSTEPIGNSLVEGYVCRIHELIPSVIWQHVSTEDNPADIASRGSSPDVLAQKQSWWKGPDWLSNPSTDWSKDIPIEEDLNNTKLTCFIQHTQAAVEILSKFSRFDLLIRFIIRLRRYVRRKFNRGITPDVLAPITAAEFNDGFLACAKLSQNNSFLEELKEMNLKHRIIKGCFKGLNPFLDSNGLLRVGGRLQNSVLPFEEKHPVILSSNCPLSQLLISWSHHRALHGGFRSTYAHVIKRAWIVGGKRKIKAHIKKCLICVKLQARPMVQAMAPLPTARVTPARAFSRTGVDYAGPFQILSAKGRGIRTTKGYIAVFVCLSTKAIHLELVGDLTTESFLGALSRFYGRRGKPSELWSDNATNFHGADAELRNALIKAELNWGCVAGKLAEQGIQWKFIPPAAPHFGGLWNAGVKSVKSHLKRVIGPKHLNSEKFSTLLVNVEMILNCRPLTSINGDLDDLEVLTPGHFLIGTTLSSVPEPSMVCENMNKLTHWKLVKAMRDNFWNRWCREYLNTLQQRHKWNKTQANLEKGDVVTVLDPSLIKQNGQWPLGRVLQVHTGKDGLTRVATVKTESGEYVRPIVKLALMPVESNNEASQKKNKHKKLK